MEKFRFAEKFYTNAEGTYHIELRLDDQTEQQSILYEIDAFAVDDTYAVNMGLTLKYGYLLHRYRSWVPPVLREFGVILVVTSNVTSETLYQDEQGSDYNFLSRLNTHF